MAEFTKENIVTLTYQYIVNAICATLTNDENTAFREKALQINELPGGKHVQVVLNGEVLACFEIYEEVINSKIKPKRPQTKTFKAILNAAQSLHDFLALQN